MPSASHGRLIVFSGPSGAGKTTVLEKVLARCPWIEPSISATTRPPRPGEQAGVHYYFLSTEDFNRRREGGEFLECSEVFGRGHWYGTLQSEVAPRLAAGKSVLLEIDVTGMLAVLQRYPDAITIFVRPASVEELERRLKARGTESAEAIARRLEVARQELAYADRYQYVINNDVLEDAVNNICSVLAQLEESR
ncbi:MAG: guanylate kinase [Pirellulales bacterium]|nr:guanylate kinase [Pirellulales bacterium]